MCDLDPKVKVIGTKSGICDGVPSTAALVFLMFMFICLKRVLWKIKIINININNNSLYFQRVTHLAKTANLPLIGVSK